jgi:hypothetical protein
MSTLTGPPRYVPTLTEVVRPAPAPVPESSAVIALAATPVVMPESMARRVLQRIDPILEQRLHQAIGQLVLVHAHALMPGFREEIERVVRQSVIDAFQQEFETPPDQVLTPGTVNLP